MNHYTGQQPIGELVETRAITDTIGETIEDLIRGSIANGSCSPDALEEYRARIGHHAKIRDQ